MKKENPETEKEFLERELRQLIDFTIELEEEINHLSSPKMK